MNGDLRSKIVLLDFWTQGCVNCLHVIPDLRRLEQEFADELVVVGVHWAKFDSERTTVAVSQAVRRLDVEHPVVNDELELLRAAYGVRAWPTLILIDPLGNVVGAHEGEGAYAVFQPAVATLAREFGANDLIDPTPLGDLLQAPGALPTLLSFPGKVLADEAGGRLFIADTGHHRVLVADLDGRLTDVIGTGARGDADGDFADAGFARPQGMALSEGGNVLYIADRENHTVRAADLTTRRVATIAGTGEPVTVFAPGDAVETAIASPWDLHREGRELFIAGAGRHQLWRLNLRTGRLDLFAGTGAEGIVDGPRLLATLSQPSGLTAGGGFLYFSDPEASAVRAVSLRLDGELTTLVGRGLFDWGDAVGDFDATRLQHAVGIELVGDADLYVADTYNHRIKLLDLATGTSRVVAGDGTVGLADGRGESAQLAEPSGLSATSSTLYVADTNNHRIRTLDLAGGELTTLALTNLDLAVITATGLAADVVTPAPQRVAPGAVEIVAELDLPDGYKFNTGGRFTFEWDADAVLVPAGPQLYEAMGPRMPIRFEAEVPAGAGADGAEFVLRAESTVFYCPATDEAFCLVRDVSFTAPVVVSADGADAIELRHALPSAEDLERQLGAS
ncbi:MAG TPA: hypothetical protein DEP66_06650 [Acidimicrobiaceae bacterium]|nr:hypothetical protein [Acidimicrobiaceae bacterium]HCB37863.1 hypothetical protein [Acidimicrobiaceae bacterium]